LEYNRTTCGNVDGVSTEKLKFYKQLHVWACTS